METLKLDQHLKKQPVILVDEEGREREYTLREVTGNQRNKYLDGMKDRIKIGPDGQPSAFKSFIGLQSGLLSMCLYDADGKPVSKEFVEGLPASTQQALFSAAQKLSGMDVHGKASVEAQGNG